MSSTTTLCDHCHDTIDRGGGFSFYSSVTIDLPGHQNLTGNRLLCKACTDKIITAENWTKPPPPPRERIAQQAISNPARLAAMLRPAHEASIVQNCRRLGLSPEEAKTVAQRLARVWWLNPESASDEIAQYWSTGKLLSSQKAVATETTAISQGWTTSLWLVWSFFPFLNWVAWMHAGIRARRPVYWMFAAAYLALIVPYFVLFPGTSDAKARQEFLHSTTGDITMSLICVGWLGGIAHCFWARKRVNLRIKYATLTASEKADGDLERRIAAEYGMHHGRSSQRRKQR